MNSKELKKIIDDLVEESVKKCKDGDVLGMSIGNKKHIVNIKSVVLSSVNKGFLRSILFRKPDKGGKLILSNLKGLDKYIKFKSDLEVSKHFGKIIQK